MKKKILVLAMLPVMLLSACGGGGGSDAAAPSIVTNPTTPTVPPVLTSDLQTVVPAPTYAANAPELQIFEAYNSFRNTLGLGLLLQ